MKISEFLNQSAFQWVLIVLFKSLTYSFTLLKVTMADLIQTKVHRLARSFNLSFRYVDDMLSLNNPSFGYLIYRIYPKELEIRDTTDTVVNIIS